jgi:hypothetical protein
MNKEIPRRDTLTLNFQVVAEFLSKILTNSNREYFTTFRLENGKYVVSNKYDPRVTLPYLEGSTVNPDLI